MGKMGVADLPAKPEIRTAADPTVMRVIPELAQQIGLNESIALLQIAYWIRIGGEHIDGKWWTYQSIRDMKAKGFSYWSVATINRTVVKLVKEGYIHESNYNKKKYDKTRWLALNLDKIKELKGVTVTIGDTPYQNETGLSQNETRSNQNETRSAQNETTIPETTTEITTEKKNTPTPAFIPQPEALETIAATSAAYVEKPLNPVATQQINDILVKTDADSLPSKAKEKNVRAPAKPKEPKPETDKPESENYKRLFEGVALVCYSIDFSKLNGQQLDKNIRKRIGELASKLNQENATPDQLWAFSKWYKSKFPNAVMPRDPTKFYSHWLAFLPTYQPAKPGAYKFDSRSLPKPEDYQVNPDLMQYFRPENMKKKEPVT